MEQVFPWKDFYALTDPFYLKAGKRHPPAGLELMLRIHFLQSCFHSARIAAEEALYDMESMRHFVGIDLGNGPVPDETTICKFRHLLETHDLGERIFQEVKTHLEENGLKLSEGTIMDATIINTPSSTKKGNQYYFDMKIHVGVNKESRTVHSLVTTPANVHDSKMVEDILQGEENAASATRPTRARRKISRKKRSVDLI